MVRPRDQEIATIDQIVTYCPQEDRAIPCRATLCRAMQEAPGGRKSDSKAWVQAFTVVSHERKDKELAGLVLASWKNFSRLWRVEAVPNWCLALH